MIRVKSEQCLSWHAFRGFLRRNCARCAARKSKGMSRRYVSLWFGLMQNEIKNIELGNSLSGRQIYGPKQTIRRSIVAVLTRPAAFRGNNRYNFPPVVLFSYLFVSSRLHLVSCDSTIKNYDYSWYGRVDSPANHEVVWVGGGFDVGIAGQNWPGGFWWCGISREPGGPGAPWSRYVVCGVWCWGYGR